MTIRNWFLLMLAPLLVACTSNQQVSEQDIVNSMQRVDNYDGLILHYKEQLQRNNNDQTAALKLAQTYLEKGDTESAKFYADHLLSQGVKNWQLMQLRGEIYDKEANYAKAVTLYQQSIAMGNQSSDVHVLLGIAHSKLDQFSQAEAQFNQARLKGHSDMVIKNNLAVIYLAQGEYQRVTDLLMPVYKDNPTNRAVKANLAIALFKQGLVQQARELLNQDYSDSQVAAISQRLYDVGG
ncbi:tetratricopeptide repeat protein [Vibrio hippocampi]|uniref:Tetratricopeptide repeat protein n=1 Tax=Vibrio hippocampi TaxID=654686 RepID=A0ABM8ZMH2_9VIBR|nr:tetratricopeptide repeat protein [Vibrio hippocampi]CAH0529500.1 hypothetical protein VHP8226_03254 [Vibrio hippocampi]